MKESIFLTGLQLLTCVAFAAEAPRQLPPMGASRPESKEPFPTDCGTYPGIEKDIAARNAFMSALAQPKLPTTQTRDVGNIAILEDDGTLIYEDGDGLHINDYAVANKFYQT